MSRLKVGLLTALMLLLVPAVARAGALTWSAPIPLVRGDSESLPALACPSSSQCTAVDAIGRVLTFNPSALGSPAPVLVDPGQTLVAVSCPSTGECVAVDANAGREVTFDPGQPGATAPVTIDPGRGLTSVSCPSTTQCTAADDRGDVVTFDPLSPGAPSPVAIDTVQGFNAVSCFPESPTCTAVDGAGNEVTFNPLSPGSGPSMHALNAPQPVTAVACWSSVQCTAVSQNKELTFTTDIFDLASVTIPAANDFTAVACGGSGLAAQCTAADAVGNETTFAVNDTPSPSTVPVDSGQDLRAVACPTTGSCVAVDNNGGELTFAVPPSGTPSRPAIDTVGLLIGVSCPAVSQCTAIDLFGHETTFDPLSPASPASLLVDSSGLDAVACPSSSECVGVDGSGGEVTFDPATVSAAPARTVLHAGDDLVAVSCPSLSQCTAVGSGSEDEVTFNPEAPATVTPVIVDPVGMVDSVACPSTTQCTAVDEFGGVATFDPLAPPSSPSTAAIGSINNGLAAVACPSASQCTALEGASAVVTFDPTNPGSPAAMTIDTSVNFLLGLACPSTTVCVAVDSGNGVFQGDPTSPAAWSATNVAGASQFNAVTCASATRCAAVDLVGDAFSGIDAPVDVTAPQITGAPIEGQTLTESHGTWSQPPDAYAYQWQDCDAAGANCAAIAGATAPSYTLQGSDLGHTIRVQETATAAGLTAAAVSAPTPIVTVPTPIVITPQASTVPSISGHAVQGQTLTESHAVWSDLPTSFVYQWEDCDAGGGACTAIAGATAQTHRLSSSDVGHTIRVQETAVNAGGAGSPAASAATSVVAVVNGRVTVGRVTVSGSAAAVPLTCAGVTGQTCSVTLSITVVETLQGAKVVAVSARRPRTRVVTLGSIRVTLAAGTRRTVRVALNRTGKALRSARGRLTAKLTVSASGGRTVTRTPTFTVPRKRR